MESLYLLVPIGIVLIAVAAAILLWAVRSGQYDDLDREASRILFDEPSAATKNQAGGDDHDNP
ncbi:MAG: cbb3-type cytochrome oxidase assembly protein CcoS [Gammaproteobacteria bacterium]|nr:MAG: cbb3-type cytochrome oxidase assembly protein CcoS [Gammaproteobacteria bacterium]